LGLFGENPVAIDSSKFKAVNNRDWSISAVALLPSIRGRQAQSSLHSFRVIRNASDGLRLSFSRQVALLRESVAWAYLQEAYWCARAGCHGAIPSPPA
jgi:hypothetical protein